MKRKTKKQIEAEEQEALREDLVSMDPDELRAELEIELRKQKRADADKKAYSKSCNEIIKESKQRSDMILEVLEDYQTQALRVVA